MEVTVEQTQDLGTYTILDLRLGDTLLKARIEEDQQAPSGRAYVRFPDDHVGFYVDEFRVEVDDE